MGFGCAEAPKVSRASGTPGRVGGGSAVSAASGFCFVLV